MNDEQKPDQPEDGATRVMEPQSATTAAQPDAPYQLEDFAGSGSLLDRLELPLEVRLGKLTWSLEKVLETRVGDAVPIGPEGEEAVVLYVQDRPYAIGDLVVVEGRFAFRVRELIGDSVVEAG